MRQLQALCVLVCNQQHFLCGRLCCLIGVLANIGREEKSVFFSCVLCCSLASEPEEPRRALESALRPGTLHIRPIGPFMYYESGPRRLACEDV